MLCGSASCGCAFESVGLNISIGAEGQVVIEPAGPGIVTTSAAVSSPFQGQTIYETVTGRLKVYDGTNWVIYGGKWPGVNAVRTTNLATTTAVAANMTLPTEVYDTDAFHSASGHQFTIPATLGGKYMFAAGATFDTTGAGTSSLDVAITSNTGGVGEFGSLRAGGFVPASITSHNLAKELYLAAGAVITMTVIQNSGGTRQVNPAFGTLRMVEHIPSLV